MDIQKLFENQIEQEYALVKIINHSSQGTMKINSLIYTLPESIEESLKNGETLSPEAAQIYRQVMSQKITAASITYGLMPDSFNDLKRKLLKDIRDELNEKSLVQTLGLISFDKIEEVNKVVDEANSKIEEMLNKIAPNWEANVDKYVEAIKEGHPNAPLENIEKLKKIFLRKKNKCLSIHHQKFELKVEFIPSLAIVGDNESAKKFATKNMQTFVNEIYKTLINELYQSLVMFNVNEKETINLRTRKTFEKTVINMKEQLNFIGNPNEMVSIYQKAKEAIKPKVLYSDLDLVKVTNQILFELINFANKLEIDLMVSGEKYQKFNPQAFIMSYGKFLKNRNVPVQLSMYDSLFNSDDENEQELELELELS